MTLYKIIAKQKITKRVLVVVEANSYEDAMNKVSDRNIISTEKTLDMKIDEYIPIETEK